MPLQQQAQHRTLILFIEPRNRDQPPYLIKRRVRAFRSRSRSNPCSQLIYASPEEVARVEQLIAREPVWRAEQDAARIARLIAQLEDPEARIEALLQREQAWHATRLEQARQQSERATGQVHTFAVAAQVTGRLVDRVELVGDAFGLVLGRDGQLAIERRELRQATALATDLDRYLRETLYAQLSAPAEAGD